MNGIAIAWLLLVSAGDDRDKTGTRATKNEWVSSKERKNQFEKGTLREGVQNAKSCARGFGTLRRRLNKRFSGCFRYMSISSL